MVIVERVRNEIGLMGERGLSPGLILRALVDDLAIIHVELVQVIDPSMGDRGDMKVLDTMQVGQCKGKSFSFFGCDERIDLNHVNWLLTFPVATTVAKGLPASGETSKENVSHHCHPCRTTDASQYANCSGTNAAAVPRPLHCPS
jgi:hypothetical protein